MLKTFSGGKYIITEDQEKNLRGLPDKMMVDINGNQVNTSSISEIVELGEYYRQNPKERPESTPEHFQAEETTPYNLFRYKKALTSMVKGFKQRVTSQGHPISPNQQKILNKMEEKMEALNKTTEKNFKPRAMDLNSIFNR